MVRCNTCKYREATYEAEFGGKCNYLRITGTARVCPVDNCHKYEKGKRIKKCAAITIRHM